MSHAAEQTFTLLTGGQEFFPALIAVIEKAHTSIVLETYIFDFNGVGATVAQTLCDAATRGVQVRVLADGIGTPEVPAPWVEQLDRSGVAFAQYRPLGSLGLLVPSHWRRLHRKLCVVDEQVAFCGGINILDDWHDPNHGTLAAPRFDFALRLTGPMVATIAQQIDQLWVKTHTQGVVRRVGKKVLQNTKEVLKRLAQGVKVQKTHHVFKGPGHQTSQLLLRDNLRHRRVIERAYLSAIAGARSEITLANAYFLPGKALRLALLRAAKRGVKVRILLQGRYEYFMQFHAARAVYLPLLKAGVGIYEYTPSFLHAKAATVDAHGTHPWATIGSSNLDPLSLLLAREANVAVTGFGIPAQLAEQIDRAIAQDARQVLLNEVNQAPLWQKFLNRVAYMLMRTALFLTGNRY